jgi:plasmid maintenance system antidote protein VapI
MEKINLKLKAKIVEKFGTQERFASVCFGRNPNWISRIVRGQRSPTVGEKARIGEALGIKPEDLDSYFETVSRQSSDLPQLQTEDSKTMPHKLTAISLVSRVARCKAELES